MLRLADRRPRRAGDRSRRRRRPLATLLVALAAAGCLDLTPADDPGGPVVLAPQLLQAGVRSALDGYAEVQTTPVQPPRFGSCAEVARAAVAGQAAIVLTAHPSWGDYIAERVTVVDRATLGSDSLVVVGPAGASGDAALADLDGLLDGPDVVGVPSTESASVGMYTREALLRYGIWSQVEPKLRTFPGLDAAFAALDAGELDAVISTRSAAARRGRGVLLTVDPAFHRPIRYEVLLLDGNAGARTLFDYLTGRDGRSAFEQAGFEPPEPGAQGP